MASPPLSTPSRTTERVFDRCGQPGRAWNDVSEGLRQWELWGVLGLQDIRQRYRRSILGPFWVTLSMGMMIGGLGVIYSTIFKTSDAFYVPYLATGLIVWTLITGLIADGCICFSGGGEWIKQLPAPLCSYVFRMIWRNLIIFCHNMVIYFVVIVAYAMWPGFANLLLAGLGTTIICISGFCTALILGVASARFRDIPPMVLSVLQVVFFVTPIIWSASQLPERAPIVVYNPLAYFVEIVRGPLLGQAPALNTWLVAIATTAALGAIAAIFFVTHRRRVAYWV